MPPPPQLGKYLIAVALAVAPVVSAEEKITFPPELQLAGDTLEKDKNGMSRLLEHLERPDSKLTEEINLALKQLRGGKPVDDADLLKEIRERHKIALHWFKPPVQCLRQRDSSSFIVVFFNLFKGAEILFRQSVFEGNRNAAEEHLVAMLEWSRLIRNGNPTAIEASIAHAGWRLAFTFALQDWESHPDQEARLRELAELFSKNRIPRDEWAVVIRREAQWWADQGGTKGCLENFPEGQNLGEFILKEPFNKLSNEQLLELPYDRDAEIAQYTKEWLTQLRCLREGEPLQKWPDFHREGPKDPTLEDYRKRPNGLGDLLLEQSNGLFPCPQLSPFFNDAAMETCLTWLKAEQSGKPFPADATDTARDPMDGNLLRVDAADRMIRSIGVDLVLEEAKAAPLSPGFNVGPEDPTLVVPRWRGRK